MFLLCYSALYIQKLIGDVSNYFSWHRATSDSVFHLLFTHKTRNVPWQQVIRVVDHGEPLSKAITCVHSAKSIK